LTSSSNVDLEVARVGLLGELLDVDVGHRERLGAGLLGDDLGNRLALQALLGLQAHGLADLLEIRVGERDGLDPLAPRPACSRRCPRRRATPRSSCRVAPSVIRLGIERRVSSVGIEPLSPRIDLERRPASRRPGSR